MIKSIITIILALFINSCSEKTKVDVDDGYSGVWVLYDDALTKGHDIGEFKSKDLVFSETIIITSGGDGEYYVRGIKNIGDSPSLSSRIGMELTYKGVPSANIRIDSDDTFLADAYHLIRFSSHNKPVAFDLEVREASKEYRWISAGKYIRVPSVDTSTHRSKYARELDKNWKTHQ